MKFTRIIGKVNEENMKKIRQAQDYLSAIFMELSLGYANKSLGTKTGGDPLVFQLVYPLPHICDAVEMMLDEKSDAEILKDIKTDGLTKEEIDELPESVKKFRSQMKGKILRTAATDGKNFYWNPKFILETYKKNPLGLRLVINHEAWHAIYTHPSRRGSKMPALWNIAVDYKVNFTAMEDLKARGFNDSGKLFKEALGDYIHLNELAEFYKNPLAPPARLAHLNPINGLKEMADPAYKKANDKNPPMYYADENLKDDFKKPEHIYEYLLKQIPKCPECGKLGFYKKTEEYKKWEKKAQQAQQANGKNKDKSKDGKKPSKSKGNASGENNQVDSPGDNGEGQSTDGHSHGDSGHQCDHDHGHDHGNNPSKNGKPGNGKGNQPSDQDGGDGEGQSQSQGGKSGKSCGGCENNCNTCGNADGNSDYVHIPYEEFGSTLDDHIDSDISEEDLAKRIHEAVTAASKMTGRIPGGLEDELGILTQPKLTWQDFVRRKMQSKREGYGKNDWTRAKHRPLFAGLFTPRKRDYFVKVLFGFDTSGSMGKEDIAFGVSQIQVLGERAVCHAVPWDSVCYWQEMVKIDKVDLESLKQVKIVGRGGTEVSSLFNEYEEHVGKVDIIVIATDGYLYDQELDKIKEVDKDTEIVWLITSNNEGFRPKRGRIFNLHNM